MNPGPLLDEAGPASTPAAVPRGWRWREREGSWLAGAVSAACLVFSLWPQLDLEIGRAFVAVHGGFVGDEHVLVRAVYQAVPWLGRAVLPIALAVQLLRCWRPRMVPLHLYRRLLALALSMLLAVGLVVNGGLKEHWGRPRPSTVAELGGQVRFEPALRQAESCRHNCSFVSGHASTGFALMSLGLLGTPATRRRWWRIGMAAGGLIGACRIAQGGHFLSDVVFAGLVVWACHAAVRQAWLVRAARRRQTRTVPQGSGSRHGHVPAAPQGPG